MSKECSRLARKESQMQMAQKRNVIFYQDTELVEKTKELGFNLSKTFENHLKHFVSHFQNVYPENNDGNNVFGSPGEIRTLVSGSRARHAWPLHHRASTRNTWILCNIFNVEVSKQERQQRAFTTPM